MKLEVDLCNKKESKTMGALASALTRVELGVIGVEQFCTILTEMADCDLRVLSREPDEICFGGGEAKDEVWIAILEEMKKRDYLTLALLSMWHGQVDHCKIQKEIERIFVTLSIEEEIGILFEVFATAPVVLQEIIYTTLSCKEMDQEELVLIFKNTSSLTIQNKILALLQNGPPEILACLFLATTRVEIQRIIAHQESLATLPEDLILLLVVAAKDTETGKYLLSIIKKEQNENKLLGESLDELTMEDLVDLFNGTYNPSDREMIMGVITSRISEMTPFLHLLLLGHQNVRSQLTSLGMLIMGQIIDPKEREESQTERDIKNMGTEDLVDLFTKLRDPNSPIRHLIGTELKKRLSA